MTDRLVTYRYPDREPIAGEYTWVTDTEFFADNNDGEDYYEVIEETWIRTSQRTLIYGRLDRWCSVCDEDVTLTQPINGDVYCPNHTP